MIGLEKRARSSFVNAAGLSLGTVFEEFLEPFFHQAVRLRNVYEQRVFEQTTAFDVPVWRCNHPAFAQYLSQAAAACRRGIEDGKLSRVSVSFFDGDHRKTDEVCVRFGSLPKVGEKEAALLRSWFRETILVLESRMSGLTPAASFQVELVYMGPLTNEHEWVLVEGPSDNTPEPAVMEPVKSLGQTIPVEVFVKRFL